MGITLSNRVDIRWLLPKYRNLGEIRANPTLTPEEKAVLEGVHKRDHHNGRRALQPSQLDYITLNEAYKSQSNNYFKLAIVFLMLQILGIWVSCM